MKFIHDANVTKGMRRHERRAFEHAKHAQGYSSSLWVNCPRCAVGRGDPCRQPGTCEARHKANAERLLALPTWAVVWITPCCKARTLLTWRTARDALDWVGVPCMTCNRTYAVGFHVSDLTEQRQQIERLHPDSVEMVCWALEAVPL